VNFAVDPRIFRDKLIAWSVRGVIGAAPSFTWALMAGFKSPAAIAGMAAGVATYVLAFAWLTASPNYVEYVESADSGWSLRLAANLRVAGSLLALGYPDMILGWVSLSVVGAIDGAQDPLAAAGGGAFAPAYVTTLVQGLLVSVTILVGAVLLWPVRCWWRRRKAQLALP